MYNDWKKRILKTVRSLRRFFITEKQRWYFKEQYEDKKMQLQELSKEKQAREEKERQDKKQICEKLGHVWKVEDQKILGKTGAHIAWDGDEYEMQVKERCVICGRKQEYFFTGIRSYGDTVAIPEKHQKMLSEAIAKRKEIEKEIKEVEKAIKELEWKI